MNKFFFLSSFNWSVPVLSIVRNCKSSVRESFCFWFLFLFSFLRQCTLPRGRAAPTRLEPAMSGCSRRSQVITQHATGPTGSKRRARPSPPVQLPPCPRDYFQIARRVPCCTVATAAVTSDRLRFVRPSPVHRITPLAVRVYTRISTLQERVCARSTYRFIAVNSFFALFFFCKSMLLFLAYSRYQKYDISDDIVWYRIHENNKHHPLPPVGRDSRIA